jgi:arylsulfatase A
MRFFLALVLFVASLHAADKPNIVLIFADDLGVNDIGCYGRKDHNTPHLDRLADQGIRFTNAYTAQPICSPSRAALMTGKHPARLHLTNYLPGRADAPTQKLRQPRIEGQLPLEEWTIAELLKGAGYATGLFGKWHLGGAEHSPAKQGFDEVVMPPGNSKPTATEGGKSEYAITTAAEKFIEANKDRPFFCYIPHNNPHIPIGAKPELIEKNAKAYHPGYGAMIETLDDAVGRILAKLEALGLAEKTIVIFTSDNGGLHCLEFPGTPATFNAPYRAGKGYVYEGGLREPLIIRWPGLARAGSLCNDPVVLTDLVPTLLRAAGVDPAKTVGPLDGVDITKLIRGETMPPRSLFWHFPNYTNQGGRPAGAVRDGKWKLVEQFEDDTVELFDLEADVSESKNLAADQPKIAADLRKKLADWRTSVGAQMPVPNAEFDAARHKALYVDFDPSVQKAGATAAADGLKWQAWREAMNAAAKGNKPRVTPANGIISLHARAATVHATKMKYEEQTYKNVLGFWVNPADWAEWTFETAAEGTYTLDILQGCGKGSGGAEVEFAIGEQKLRTKIVETGHFQHMIRRDLGTVKLPAGKHTLTVKPQTKPGAAVMDLREVRLIPE